MKVTHAFLAFAAGAVASPLSPRACPNIHVFGARETTASPGYGSSSTVVNDILSGYPGSTAEAISYPACGGQASCGGDSYSQSVAAGVAAATTAVNNFAATCPSTQLVLVGYSQRRSYYQHQSRFIFMGDPLYHLGLPYNVGTCAAGGFDARPAGFSCPSAANIRSYCDATDPYCCNGSNAATHAGYGAEYGSQAYSFVKSKLTGELSKEELLIEKLTTTTA
ncbi:Acetylxylan esterase 2 [Hyphodiscus hymeniophilus]|uniref:Acetylxylan esterase 2 n=1 Tax=Hyphodiscus hymeniophilus TaxID=353542 RepID=A0A9P6VIC0_9HELO|nr:Acetylxylan esterase 2 [Hyphodiscus hymeniophilus]